MHPFRQPYIKVYVLARSKQSVGKQVTILSDYPINTMSAEPRYDVEGARIPSHGKMHKFLQFPRFPWFQRHPKEANKPKTKSNPLKVAHDRVIVVGLIRLVFGVTSGVAALIIELMDAHSFFLVIGSICTMVMVCESQL